MKIRIITDDFTSASDGIAAFAQLGWACSVALLPHANDAAEVLSCDTDSRLLGADEAAEQVRAWAAAWRDADVLIKQFDSTLRGPWAREVLTARQASGRRKLVIAPAFPDAGRTTVHGEVLVDGVPVSRTAFARDPLNPVTQSSLWEQLQAHGLSVPVCEPASLAATLRTHEAAIVDVRSEAELDAVARAYHHIDDVLWCGSTGLVRAFARVLPRPGKRGAEVARVPAAQRIWICVGSRNPVSLEQKSLVQEAAVAGLTVVGTADEPCDPHEQARALSARVATAVRDGVCDGVIATGGETARHIAQALGARKLHVLGELAPGIPLCMLALVDRPLPFVTKAGGFGEATSLLDLAGALRKLKS